MMFFFSPGLWGNGARDEKNNNKRSVNWTRLFQIFLCVYFLALAQIIEREKKMLNCDSIYITSEYLIGFR